MTYFRPSSSSSGSFHRVRRGRRQSARLADPGRRSCPLLPAAALAAVLAHREPGAGAAGVRGCAVADRSLPHHRHLADDPALCHRAGGAVHQGSLRALCRAGHLHVLRRLRHRGRAAHPEAGPVDCRTRHPPGRRQPEAHHLLPVRRHGVPVPLRQQHGRGRHDAAAHPGHPAAGGRGEEPQALCLRAAGHRLQRQHRRHRHPGGQHTQRAAGHHD